MKTALLIIATGEKYREYAKNLMASANEFFVPHDTIVFTDRPSEFSVYPNTLPVYYEHQGFPQASYRRFEAFVGASNLISKYDYCFYCDSDMKFVASVTEDDIFSNGITATEHPGYVGRRGTPETRLESTAYCPEPRTYFCGGFNGGTTEDFLKMSNTILKAIDSDDRRGIQAIWVDESHINRYLYDYPPAKILSPSFCYPEKDDYYKHIWEQAKRDPFVPKLLALDKGGK